MKKTSNIQNLSKNKLMKYVKTYLEMTFPDDRSFQEQQKTMDILKEIEDSPEVEGLMDNIFCEQIEDLEGVLNYNKALLEKMAVKNGVNPKSEEIKKRFEIILEYIP